MANGKETSAILGGILACAIGFATPLLAAPLPALDPAERALWLAVGGINSTSPEKSATCTGTLIAPDLVLTAAHCAGGTAKRTRQRHFILGKTRDAAAIYRGSVQRDVHPAYPFAKGNTRFKYDVAVLRLDTPLPADLVTPLPLFQPDRQISGPLALMGYNRGGKERLAGRFNCPVIPEDDHDVIVIDCEVVSGNSGGPVLAQVDGDWHLVGVIVGRIGSENPTTLAVPVDDWITDHWEDAWERADARGTKVAPGQ
ncbi:serine protease [uncultured Roseobacter sp.]|uniref:trypsin-like serine peptidase n=1 Tax=uncultured Roseobacter sp. TaxID=114847 RepID=UPI00260A954A|nr:trypsin-like peptidase domain-containing protein [uncultured Roseobacter sp.]